MLALITEITLRATWWVLWQTYTGLYYAYYRQWPATPEDKVNQQLDKIEHENQDLMRKIDALENLLINQRNESRSLSSLGSSTNSQPKGDL